MLQDLVLLAKILDQLAVDRLEPAVSRSRARRSGALRPGRTLGDVVERALRRASIAVEAEA